MPADPAEDEPHDPGDDGLATCTLCRQIVPDADVQLWIDPWTGGETEELFCSACLRRARLRGRPEGDPETRCLAFSRAGQHCRAPSAKESLFCQFHREPLSRGRQTNQLEEA